MMYISELMTGAPTNERCPLERRMYETLDKLKIPYERVDNDPAASMEECAEVDKVLGTEIRKNVFLCNQKKTTFFLLVMPANKSFDTAAFSKKLGVSHIRHQSRLRYDRCRAPRRLPHQKEQAARCGFDGHALFDARTRHQRRSQWYLDPAR